MPANKNAVTRYYILDELLSNRYHNYSTEDLLKLVNERLEELGQDPVSRRTIEYDMNYLENEGPFLAEIEHYQIDEVSERTLKTVKKNCHRYADPSFSIFKKEMTDDEKYLLKEALSLLGQFDGLPNLDGLESLRKGLDVKTDRQIISFTKNPLENSNLLGEIFTAISRKQVIELHYHIFEAPDEERTVEHPQCIRCGKNFALDRIDKVVPLPSKKYKPYKGDLNERFEDIIGVSLYEERPLLEIVFWVSDHSKDYVATKPIHESQRNIKGEPEEALRHKHPTLEGGRFFSIKCIENYELIHELTSFGADLVVLSPNEIRSKITARIKSMAARYEM